MIANARRGSLSLSSPGGGFILASPLLALNMVVPAFYSIPFATATASQKMVFDVVVGGGGFGEGLLMLCVWFVVVKYVKGWLGLASATVGTGEVEENPNGLSISIFSRLFHFLRNLSGGSA